MMDADTQETHASKMGSSVWVVMMLLGGNKEGWSFSKVKILMAPEQQQLRAPFTDCAKLCPEERNHTGG